jgi:hypothetical protein
MKRPTARELAAFLAGVAIVAILGLVMGADIGEQPGPTCVVGGSGGLPALVIEGSCSTVIP